MKFEASVFFPIIVKLSRLLETRFLNTLSSKMVVYLPQLPPLAKQISKNIITDFPGTIPIKKMDFIKAIFFSM